MTDLFGQAPAHASPSAPRAKEQVQPTNVTYGRIGSVSSASAALASSLAKMLNKRLDGAGSTLFAMTWRRRVTPRGRPYFQLAASARRTSGNECGSWPTPQSRDGMYSRNGQPERTGGQRRNLDDYVTLASWPTPAASDDKMAGSLESNWKKNRPATSGMRLNDHVVHRGPTSNGSLAQTAKPGQLNPDFTRWLMGYSAEHLSCAPSEMPSSRKSRPSGSA
jgi:hypothetical protein